MLWGVARAVGKRGYAQVSLHFMGSRGHNFRAWLGADIDYLPQTSGDLGDRMNQAFKTIFLSGARAALAIGSDVPGITQEILLKALEGLRSHDIVLGPAADGGYYLIGMKRLHA